MSLGEGRWMAYLAGLANTCKLVRFLILMPAVDLTLSPHPFYKYDGKMRSLFADGVLISTAVSGQSNLESEPSGTFCRRDDYNIKINTYASLLETSTRNKSLTQGKLLHAHIFINGLNQNVFLGNKLAAMYTICGSMADARLVFDKISERNAFLYNMMIRGYACSGCGEEALILYYQMQRECIQPDKFTFPFALKACAALSALQEGKEIHYHIVRSGLESDAFVGTALIDMYNKCESLEIARQVFDKISKRDLASWNAMISGYVQNGHSGKALTLFHQMQQADVIPDRATIVSVLPVCADMAALQQGKNIHDYIIKSKLESHISVGNSLVAMYSKCKSIEFARQVFDKMSRRDVVSWNAMIAGYARNGHASEALILFYQMQLTDVKPDSVTMVSVIPACAHLAALQQGKGIHAYAIRGIFDSDVMVGTTLIDMYAKCGSIKDACRVFGQMSETNVVSWTAMIAGYGMHGHGKDSLRLFNQMQLLGMTPNHITFTAVLSTCSHLGLLHEGWQYFESMRQDYHIAPNPEHYACMVDLLGRFGCLDEAYDFIQKIPLVPKASMWGALLGACRIHCNINLGEYVAERLFELEPANAGNYVVLSSIYAMAGRWDDVTKIRKLMKVRGVIKRPGCSWIEMRNRVHIFFQGDRSHPQTKKIYATLENLSEQMKKAGYLPDTNLALYDVEEEEKEYASAATVRS